MQELLYKVRGKVIRGDGYGKKLGFPTANLDRGNYVKRNLDIPFGVYAGTAVILSDVKDKGLGIKDLPCTYKAAIVIGPFDAEGLPKIEAHLLDFDGDLYDKELEFSLVQFLRLYRKFENEETLKDHIAQDMAEVRRVISDVEREK